MQSGTYSYPATSRIVYGTDFAAALKRELELVGARRVFVLASDRWVHTNPRKIDGPATVRELLDAAW